ncbi:cell wall surface anchor family protein [Minicystis rosea]|nr:cell wall surface anchor family protein [Minicystis rosea]
MAVKGADGKTAQCAAAGKALQAEKSCVGSLCAHGASLAKEWSKYCGEEDGALASQLAERAQKAPSECGAKAQAVLDKGCPNDATCEITASRWAARCAKSDGSPLILGLLGRTVAKRAALSDFTIDARSCDDLRADMRRGVTCARAACPAALKTAQAYRSRCGGSSELPEPADALAEAAINAASGQTVAPTLIRPNPPKLTPADNMPAMLHDRWGIYASVCGERPADMKSFVAARRACENGKVVIVRYFVNASKDFEVRGGTLDSPDDETFSRRFPSLRAVGELEARDDAAKQALAAELPKIAELAKERTKAADAARALVQLANQHGAALERSASVRSAFAAVDEALAPALAEIGKAKLTAAKRALAAELAGLAARAPTRPFADLNDNGAVAIGAPSAASRLDGASLFPKAMAAYTAALDDLATQAKRKPMSTGDARDLKSNAVDAAKSCATTAKRAQANERDLVGCAFTMNTCAPSKIDTLMKMLDEDRAAVITARHTIDLATSVLSETAKKDIQKHAAACPTVQQ